MFLTLGFVFDKLLALFKDLGFKQWLKKRKTSESYLHKKDKRIVIEINKVEHLGYFIEIEYLAKLCARVIRGFL